MIYAILIGWGVGAAIAAAVSVTLLKESGESVGIAALVGMLWPVVVMLGIGSKIYQVVADAINS